LNKVREDPMKKSLVLVLLAFLAVPAFPQATDWPCWRGPNHDGVSTETDWNPEALKDGAKVLWTTDVGFGYSNIAIVRGRIFAVGMRKGSYTASCLDAATGATIWSTDALGSIGFGDSTPAVDGDRMYGLSHQGVLFCLDAATGAVRWRKSLPEDYNVVPMAGIWYGWATSPLVDEDLVLVNANICGLAVNKMTGDLVWVSETPERFTPAAYPSPVPFGPPEDRTVLLFGPTKLSAVKAATGEVVW